MKTKFYLILIGICCICFNCTPDKEILPGTKSISGVIFKVSDNPGLISDISGVISGDTVKVSFESNVDLSNLVPSISHNGASISPASNTAQNFNVPVDYTITAKDGSSRKYVVLASRLLGTTKSVSSVVFKSSDNPSVDNDVFGQVDGDSIKAFFNENADLSNLIPTFIHNGISMSPLNHTPQNFNVPVNYTITAENGSSSNYVFTAKRLSLADTMLAVNGRWKVVKDSVVNLNTYYLYCYGGAGGVPHPGVYIGKPEDFWEFKPGNYLDARENSITLYNMRYQVGSGRLVWWENQCWVFNAQILELNSTNFVFYHSATSPNGGHYGRTIWLKR